MINDSYLKDLNSTKQIMNEIIREVNNVKYEQKSEKISEYLEFVRVFNTKGVQGIVGFVKIKRTGKLIVFKTSIDINRSVEHESIVINSVNKLKEYCPHFVSSLGNLDIPISTKFILDSDNRDLFTFDNACLPRNILFLECVNKLQIYQLCKKCSDKHIISSQILQILMSLDILQTKRKITHYDLHIGNILIQKCEINSVFLYKHKNDYFLVPTFGFFPLIIDMGISYSPETSHSPMYSNTDNYHRGFQTTVFDPLNDIHHVLLSLFYFIEVENDNYDHISNKIKLIFKHLPVLRKSGWKELPNNIIRLVTSQVRHECRKYKRYKLFVEYEKDVFELLNNLIILPLGEGNETNLNGSFDIFMEELDKLIDIDDFDKYDTLFILREVIWCINETRTTSNLNFKTLLQTRLSEVINENINYNEIDYEKLIKSGIELGKTLSHIYHKLISDHMIYIKTKYDKTQIKNPLDMFLYLSKNMTPHFTLNKETIVYCWDIEDEQRSKYSCDKLTSNDLNNINQEYFSKKGELLNYLLLKR